MQTTFLDVRNGGVAIVRYWGKRGKIGYVPHPSRPNFSPYLKPKYPAHSTIGINTDGSYNEGPKNAHLHFFAKYDGIGIDLRKALFKAGIGTVKAFDAGPDGDSETFDDARSVIVSWNDSVKMWVNDDYKLILDRRQQLPSSPGVTTNCYWLAWEKGKSIEQMKVVVWSSDKNAWLAYDKINKTWIKGADDKYLKWIDEDWNSVL